MAVVQSAPTYMNIREHQKSKIVLPENIEISSTAATQKLCFVLGGAPLEARRLGTYTNRARSDVYKGVKLNVVKRPRADAVLLKLIILDIPVKKKTNQ